MQEMSPGERIRATYAFEPVDHLVRQEFYLWDEAIARWKGEGLPEDWRERNLFGFDPDGRRDTGLDLGWCEPPFVPRFESRQVADEGATEIIQDEAGRWLRVFAGRRHGFMPDYLRHPVTGPADWEENVFWRLDPATPSRYEHLPRSCAAAVRAREQSDCLVSQPLVGVYMYLRALMGPEDLLYALHDQPGLIREMVGRWAVLADAGLARVQALADLDEIRLAEDICYNHGLLISPDMVRSFLLPAYREVLDAARSRQRRRIHLLVDTDGWCGPAIPLYREIGMDAMMPFEVASGCDVVELGRLWPDLVIWGGIDKRVLAAGPTAIDTHVGRIVPAMRLRGGYVPTCDHGVPDNVSLSSYRHYRARMLELDH